MEEIRMGKTISEMQVFFKTRPSDKEIVTVPMYYMIVKEKYFILLFNSRSISEQLSKKGGDNIAFFKCIAIMITKNCI